MAWWLTVYCKKSVAHLTPSELRSGLKGEDRSALAGVDYDTLAEDYDIDAAEVRPAVKHLEVIAMSERPLDFEIRYRPDEQLRPVVVHAWTTPERVAEELSEACEVREPPASARAALEGCREIVGIELGFSQLEDMGIVFAYEAARYLAQKGDGIIVDDDNRWQAVKKGAFSPL